MATTLRRPFGMIVARQFDHPAPGRQRQTMLVPAAIATTSLKP
jgi:hypothetical protein